MDASERGPFIKAGQITVTGGLKERQSSFSRQLKTNRRQAPGAGRASIHVLTNSLFSIVHCQAGAGERRANPSLCATLVFGDSRAKHTHDRQPFFIARST